MDLIGTELDGVVIVRPRRFADGRGWFVEHWSKRAFSAIGIEEDFVQDNLSFSREAGTVRALHYQLHPMAQGKLVQVLRGRVLDVAVDIRRGSPTFGHHVAVELTAEGGEQLYIPPGFAHGFCTLEPDVLFSYKVTSFYSPQHERAIIWNDPDIGISWPVAGEAAHLSPKDLTAPRLSDQQDLL